MEDHLIKFIGGKNNTAEKSAVLLYPSPNFGEVPNTCLQEAIDIC